MDESNSQQINNNEIEGEEVPVETSPRRLVSEKLGYRFGAVPFFGPVPSRVRIDGANETIDDDSTIDDDWGNDGRDNDDNDEDYAVNEDNDDNNDEDYVGNDDDSDLDMDIEEDGVIQQKETGDVDLSLSFFLFSSSFLSSFLSILLSSFATVVSSSSSYTISSSSSLVFLFLERCFSILIIGNGGDIIAAEQQPLFW